MADAIDGGSGKARKRPAAKIAGGQGGGKVKATIHLSPDADKRLSVHATMMEMDRSELVEWLIVTYLKRYVVSDRERGSSDGAGDMQAVA
jgi:ribbon-helix-helix CopG family protein